MVAVVHPLQKHSESTAKLFGVRSLTAASPNLHLLARRRDSTPHMIADDQPKAFKLV